MLRLYAYIPETKVLGFEKRFAVWVQGCPFSCPQCMTPNSIDFKGGFTVDEEAFAVQILQTDAIEGLTISGGEPFSQAASLSKLIGLIKQHKDLGVIIYSGYPLKSLYKKAQNDQHISHLLMQTDLLIDGLYVDKLNDGLSLRGSSNQQIHVLSPRYQNKTKDYYAIENRSVEIHLLKKELMLVGIPGKEAIKKYLQVVSK